MTKAKIPRKGKASRGAEMCFGRRKTIIPDVAGSAIPMGIKPVEKNEVDASITKIPPSVAIRVVDIAVVPRWTRSIGAKLQREGKRLAVVADELWRMPVMYGHPLRLLDFSDHGIFPAENPAAIFRDPLA